MKVILYSKNLKMFQENLKDLDFDYESDYESLKEKIKNYEGLVAFGLDNEIDLKNIKWIQSMGAGVDWAVNNKTINKNVILTRVTSGLDQLLFEYTLTRIMFYYQNLLTHHNNQINNTWKRKLSTSIVGKKVLVVGTGKIGSFIGQELNKLKLKVYGVNSSGYDIDGFIKNYTLKTIDPNIKYDIIVNVLPNTKETTNIFNKEFFKKIKTDVFINVGRGTALVVEDLVEELNNKKIKMAFLDVFKEEPLDKSSNLWGVENLIITPHIAAFMDEESLILTIKDNYNKVVNDEIVDKVDLGKGY